jgi:hypothetical protein
MLMAAFLAGAVGVTACGVRRVPYHFRAPLVGSVSAPALERPDRASRPAPPGRRPPHRVAIARGERPPPAVRLTVPAAPLRSAGRAGEDLALELRGLVGRRDDRASHAQFALAALGGIGTQLDPELAAVVDGPALVELARGRGALVPVGAGEAITSPPRLGDLLVFARVTGSDPASLTGVVVSVDDRGVIEFVYLARGVARRGFASVARPGDKRDDRGRVLNTFVRHSDGADPRGTRYLAGELLAATIRLAALVR